ncbi:MAG: tyrosine-type recombinase/integrase [Candidatus Lernaella stagnicola]|nr:tyrosine-type recombinase/integrase [Candidatus Lernaella stagnicola]
MKLHAAVEQFLTACREEIRLSEKTSRAYAYDLGQFSDFMQDKSLADIAEADVERYLHYLDAEQKLKNSTIRRKIMTLKALFRYFNDRGVLSATPINGIDSKYKMTKSTPKILNAQDMIRLLDFLREDVQRLEAQLRPGCGRKLKLHYENAIRDRAIIELLFASAMRIGELSELDLESADLESRTVHICGKGHRDRTLVLGNNATVDALRDYLRIRRNRQSDTVALFLNRFGGRLSIFAIENLFERIRKAAGIRRRLTPHALRHTMATMLLNNGKNIRDVQHILGHSSAVTTQIYQEIAPRRQRKVLQVLNDEDRLSVETLDESAPPKRRRTIRRRKIDREQPMSFGESETHVSDA